MCFEEFEEFEETPKVGTQLVQLQLFSFCFSIKLTKFTRLRVWTQFFYWPDQYPAGPDDRTCKIPLSKRREIAAFDADHISAHPVEERL